MTFKEDAFIRLARTELAAMKDARTRDAFVAALIDGLTNTHSAEIAERVSSAILAGLPGGRLDQSSPLTAKNVLDAISALGRVGVEIIGEDARIAPDWSREVRGSA